MLSGWGNNVVATLNMVREETSRVMRTWYIKGQKDYRAGNTMPEGMTNTEQEGWHMGWQSDYADDKAGLEFSCIGYEVQAHDQTYLSRLLGSRTEVDEGPEVGKDA